MDRLQLKSLTVAVVQDQIGKPEPVMFGLDYRNQVWTRAGFAGTWEPVDMTPGPTLRKQREQEENHDTTSQ